MRGRLLQRAVGVRENGEIKSFNNCHLACSNVKPRIFAKKQWKGFKKGFNIIELLFISFNDTSQLQNIILRKYGRIIQKSSN